MAMTPDLCILAFMSQMPLTWSKKYAWSKTLSWNGLAPNPNQTMAQENQLSFTITAQQMTDILAAIATLKQKLSFVIGLTNQQRHDMLKLGDKTVGFEEKCATYMANRPDLIPPYIDMAELAKDRAARGQVATIMRALGEVTQSLDDTDMQLSHEILMPDLSFYNNVQLSAHNKVPGAQPIYDDLSQRFPGRKGGQVKPAKA